MAKKPFSIRVEQNVTTRFKALSTVLRTDGDKLLEEMISERELELTTDQEAAYKALLKIWYEELSE